MRRVRQGDIWIADLPEPVGNLAGFRRPVVIVQGNLINESKLVTYLAVPLTSNLKWQNVPTNLALLKSQSGLPRDSVAQPTLLQAVADAQLIDVVGAVSDKWLQQLFHRLDIVLGRS